MKCVFIMILSVIVAIHALDLSPEQKAKVKVHNAVCLAETKVDPAVVESARKGQFPEDPLLKKFVLCFLKRAKLVNSKGNLKEDVLLAKLPKNANPVAVRVIIELCKSQKGVDAADTAFVLYKCFYEATPDHKSLI